MAKINGEIGKSLRILNPPHVLAEALVRVLTFSNPDYEKIERYSPHGTKYTKLEPTRCMATLYPDSIEIPRGYDYTDRLPGEAKRLFDSIKWTDKRREVPVTFPNCKATLNEEQAVVVERFKKALAKGERFGNTYTFVLPTSGGKTLLQAYLASLTGQRTLVLCRTNLIRKAWENDLNAHFGIPFDEIGRIQRAKESIGDVFTLGSIATLGRREFKWEVLFSQFGCVIVDELQITGADSVHKIVSNCPSKFIIGMSATDKRKDGKDFVIHTCLGRPLMRIANKQEETSSSFPLGSVDIIKTDYEWVLESGEVVYEPDFYGICEDMRQDKARNDLIVEKVVADWKAGNSVLVVSHRIAHCKKLCDKLVQAGVVDANLLTGETNTHKTYTESLIQAIMNRTVRCVVASKEVIKLGANLNPLNVLHCALPIGSASDLEQLVGRIRRKWEGKTGCRLVWYYDSKVPYMGSKYKRVLIPTLRKLKVPGYTDLYVA